MRKLLRKANDMEMHDPDPTSGIPPDPPDGPSSNPPKIPDQMSLPSNLARGSLDLPSDKEAFGPTPAEAAGFTRRKGIQQETKSSFKEVLVQDVRKQIANPWRDVNLEEKIRIESPLSPGDIPKITVDEDILQHLAKNWATSIIIKPLGLSISFQTLERKLKDIWNPSGRMTIVDLTNGYSIVRFDKEADFSKVLIEGPWSIFGHCIMVKRWDAHFNPLCDSIHTVCSWIRLPDLPVVFYEEEILRQITRCVGQPIRVDTNTIMATRGKFARICVEIDLQNPLVGALEINGRRVEIEYEGLGEICTGCGRQGHLWENCSLVSQIAQQQTMTTVADAAEKPIPPPRHMNGALGTWMMGRYQGQSNPFPKKSSVPRQRSAQEIKRRGNRFAALETNTEETNQAFVSVKNDDIEPRKDDSTRTTEGIRLGQSGKAKGNTKGEKPANSFTSNVNLQEQKRGIEQKGKEVETAVNTNGYMPMEMGPVSLEEASRPTADGTLGDNGPLKRAKFMSNGQGEAQSNWEGPIIATNRKVYLSPNVIDPQTEGNGHSSKDGCIIATKRQVYFSANIMGQVLKSGGNLQGNREEQREVIEGDNDMTALREEADMEL